MKIVLVDVYILEILSLFPLFEVGILAVAGARLHAAFEIRPLIVLFGVEIAGALARIYAAFDILSLIALFGVEILLALVGAGIL